MVIDREQELGNELESARQEVLGLKQEKEDLTREIETRDKTITELKQAGNSKDAELETLKHSAINAEAKVVELNDALVKNLTSYKALVVESNPGVLADLIKGNTIEEVNESLKNARSLIDKVRQELEGKASRSRVPAGAPQRSPVDLSALSPREKITFAIGGKK